MNNQLNTLKENECLSNGDIDVLILKKNKNEEFIIAEKDNYGLKIVVRKLNYFRNKKMKRTINNSFFYLSNLQNWLNDLKLYDNLQLIGYSKIYRNLDAALYKMMKHYSYTFYLKNKKGFYFLTIEEYKAYDLICNYYKENLNYDFNEEIISINYFPELNKKNIEENNVFYFINESVNISEFENDKQYGFCLDSHNNIKIITQSISENKIPQIEILNEKKYIKFESSNDFVQKVNNL